MRMNKKERLGLYKWFRENLTPPIDIEDIYKEVLYDLRVHGWENLDPKKIDGLRLLIAAGKKIDLQPLDDLIASLEGVKKASVASSSEATMDQKTRKTVATSLRAAAAKLQAADEEFPALDPKSAMVYFDLSFEDYNLEEDQGPNADEDQKARAEEFLAMGKGKLDQAGLAAEDAAMKEIGAMLKKAGLNVRLGNEGHGSHDALVMKFGVDSVDDVKKLVKFVKGNTGGGDDVIYLNAPYMEARGFVLYPGGVNDGGFGFGAAGDGDIDEWLEAQGG